MKPVVCSDGVATSEAASGPTHELGANGSVEERVRDVVTALAAKPTHDRVTGRFVTGSVGGRAKTLAHSRHLLDALAPVKHDVVARVLADRGLDADAPEVLAGTVDGYAECRLLRQALWVRLIELGGPVTSKGKQRAMFTAYLKALKQEAELARAIGFERQCKHVDLARALSGMDEA
jgi:hypothetical protein